MKLIKETAIQGNIITATTIGHLIPGAMQNRPNVKPTAHAQSDDS